MMLFLMDPDTLHSTSDIYMLNNTTYIYIYI